MQYRFYYMKEFVDALISDYEVISLDETGLDRKIFKKKTWSPISQKSCIETKGLGKHLTLIIAVSQYRLIGFMLLESATDTFIFTYFIQKLLDYLKETGREYPQKKLFILDNARFHSSQLAKQFLLDQQLEIMFTSPYSPETNPIEHFFADFKKKIFK